MDSQALESLTDGDARLDRPHLTGMTSCKNLSSQPKILQMKLLESPAGVGKRNQLKWLPDTHIQQDGDPSAHRVGLIEMRFKQDFFFLQVAALCKFESES